MKQALPYFSPVYDKWDTEVSHEAFERAESLHEEGKYIEAIHTFLDAVGVDRRKYGDGAQRKFAIPHETLTLNLEIRDGELHLWIDYLRVPVDSRVPMLRAIARMATDSLMLARFVLKGDKLRIEYHCPLERTSPVKLVGLFNNICNVAYRDEDYLIEEFVAVRLAVPPIRPFEAKEVDRIVEHIKLLATRVLADIDEFMNERKQSEARLLISIAFFQILYFARPKGRLERKLNEALDKLDEEKPMSELVGRARTYLVKLQEMSRDELARSLFRADVLMNPKSAPTYQEIKESFLGIREEVLKSLQNNSPERAVLVLYHSIYKHYRNCEMSEALDKLFASGLAKASDKPLKEASSILLAHINELLGEEEKSRGVWSWVKGLLGFS